MKKKSRLGWHKFVRCMNIKHSITEFKSWWKFNHDFLTWQSSLTSLIQSPKYSYIYFPKLQSKISIKFGVMKSLSLCHMAPTYLITLPSVLWFWRRNLPWFFSAPQNKPFALSLCALKLFLCESFSWILYISRKSGLYSF